MKQEHDKHMEFLRPPMDAVFKYSPSRYRQTFSSEKSMAKKGTVSVTSTLQWSLF